MALPIIKQDLLNRKSCKAHKRAFFYFFKQLAQKSRPQAIEFCANLLRRF